MSTEINLQVENRPIVKLMSDEGEAGAFAYAVGELIADELIEAYEGSDDIQTERNVLAVLEWIREQGHYVKHSDESGVAFYTVTDRAAFERQMVHARPAIQQMLGGE